MGIVSGVLHPFKHCKGVVLAQWCIMSIIIVFGFLHPGPCLGTDEIYGCIRDRADESSH